VFDRFVFEIVPPGKSLRKILSSFKFLQWFL